MIRTKLPPYCHGARFLNGQMCTPATVRTRACSAHVKRDYIRKRSRHDVKSFVLFSNRAGRICLEFQDFFFFK